MSDPLRNDPSRATEAVSEADRDAKIEQLLLAGLDHYFVARYDQAINVWTRALFLDRSHPRARAYIERARSALAERQRESEELLQNGVAAFVAARRARRAVCCRRRSRRRAARRGAGGARTAESARRRAPGQADAARRRARAVPRPQSPPPPRERAWVALVVLLRVIVAAAAFGAGASGPTGDRCSTPTGADRNPMCGRPRRAGSRGAARRRSRAPQRWPRVAVCAMRSARSTRAADRSAEADADRLRAEIQNQLSSWRRSRPGGGRPRRCPP